MPIDLESSLAILKISNIDDLTPDTLKRSFKRAAIESHPDKGGSDFDNVLEAYVCLSTILRRQTGGRDGLQVIDPIDVKLAREEQFQRELNNIVSDIFDHLDNHKQDEQREKFNALFEKHHISSSGHGYEEWFRKQEDTSEPEKVEFVSTDDWNRAFEVTVTRDKPVPTSIILHPDEMAFVSASNCGTLLIPSESSYTSEITQAPEYTDLYQAYTTENTVFDKVPIFDKPNRTYDDILAERQQVYDAVSDRELEAISAYEQKKQEKEAAHMEHIKTYFTTQSSSVWALRTSNEQNTTHETTEQSPDDFVKEFK